MFVVFIDHFAMMDLFNQTIVSTELHCFFQASFQVDVEQVIICMAYKVFWLASPIVLGNLFPCLICVFEDHRFMIENG